MEGLFTSLSWLAVLCWPCLPLLSRESETTGSQRHIHIYVLQFSRSSYLLIFVYKSYISTSLWLLMLGVRRVTLSTRSFRLILFRSLVWESELLGIRDPCTDLSVLRTNDLSTITTCTFRSFWSYDLVCSQVIMPCSYNEWLHIYNLPLQVTWQRIIAYYLCVDFVRDNNLIFSTPFALMIGHFRQSFWFQLPGFLYCSPDFANQALVSILRGRNSYSWYVSNIHDYDTPSAYITIRQHASRWHCKDACSNVSCSSSSETKSICLLIGSNLNQMSFS